MTPSLARVSVCATFLYSVYSVADPSAYSVYSVADPSAYSVYSVADPSACSVYSVADPSLYSVYSVADPSVYSVAAAQQPTFRAGSEVVRVFATVLDKDGRLVPSLTKEQFEVRDDGKPQPLSLFDNTPQPIRLIVMLDVSGSMEGNLPILRDASDELFARLGRDDLARVGSFGHKIEVSPAFTRDRRELRAALPQEIAPDAPTPLWRAIDAAMDAFDKTLEGRRVVLVLSDGKDTGMGGGFQRHVSSQAGVIDRARDEDVMIYAVGMRSRQRNMPPMDMRTAMLADLPDPGLARVAEESGGGYLEIRGGEDLGSAFARVLDELHAQYLLGFAPPQRDGKVHRIEVRVTGKGMKPRARRSYVAPK
jgi:Ca-activated chloride channel homolog